MKDQFFRFAFLGVVVGIILFSRIAYPAAMPDENRPVSNLAAQTPLFVLPPVAVSADSGNLAAPEPVTASSNATSVAGQVMSGAFTKTGNAPAPTLQAAASLVADLKTGTIYESSNPGRRWPTASIAKLMSATIIEDRIPPDTRISITQQIFSQDPTEPTLAVGGTYKVGDLLDMMLMPSSNVAAEACAAFYGRGSFIDMMNQRAAAWGMKNTYFDDPSGISASDQSSANDLLTLAQHIYNDYPEIFQITRTTQTTITEQTYGTRLTIKSINQFAGTPNFVGGKTGHTDQADGNLLSVFRYQNRSIVIVVLGTDERFNASQALYDWFKANYK